MIPEITITISIRPEKISISETPAESARDTFSLSVPVEDQPYETEEDIAVPPVPEVDEEESGAYHIPPPPEDRGEIPEEATDVPPPEGDEASFGDDDGGVPEPPVLEADPPPGKKAGSARSAKSKKSTR